MGNKYYKRSRISEKKFREIVKYFAADLTSEKTSFITGISRNSCNKIFDKIRNRIYEFTCLEGKFSGEIKVEDVYFLKSRNDVSLSL